MRWTVRARYLASAVVASLLAGFIGETSYAAPGPGSAALRPLPGDAGASARSPHAPGAPVAWSLYLDVAAWRGAEAKQARNALISSWLGGLHDAGLADFTVHHMDKGLIYEVRLRHPIEAAKVSALWVAVPDGLDLPSSVLLHSGREGAVSVLELQSCTARETLDIRPDGLTPETAKTQAVSRLSAYLEAPDPMRVNVIGGPQTECRELSRMLPHLTPR